MRNNTVGRRVKTLSLAAAMLASLTHSIAPAADAPAAGPDAYTRVVETAPGTLELQIASRKFVSAKPAADGEAPRPEIWLVGAVHIADAPYYKQTQAFLNSQSLVLFEGAGRPAFADTGPADDATLIRRTRSGLRFTASLIAWYHHRYHAYPRSLPLLRQATRDQQRRESLWISRAMIDGWGNVLVYHPPAAGRDDYQLTSLGADGKPGGKHAAADIDIDFRPTDEQAAEADQTGIQAEMAHALGLVFQLDEIDYSQPNFRNSDMSMQRLQRVMSPVAAKPVKPAKPAATVAETKPAEKPAAKPDEKTAETPAEKPAAKSDAPAPATAEKPTETSKPEAKTAEPPTVAAVTPPKSKPHVRHAEEPEAPEPDERPVDPKAAAQMQQLMGMMDGSSALGGIVRIGLKLLGTSPQTQSMVKIMMIDALGSLGGDMTHMRGMPAGMDSLMKVIVEDRNQIVINDLRKVLAEKDPPKSIAIFYGAAHMPDLAKHITADLGYQADEVRWLPAFSAKATDAGMSAEEFKQMRTLIKMQLKQMQGK